jgi:hypothetical protein
MHGTGYNSDAPQGSLALLWAGVDRSRRELAVAGKDQQGTSRRQATRFEKAIIKPSSECLEVAQIPIRSKRWRRGGWDMR